MTHSMKWRWRVASALNRLPGTCWAQLVSWALGDRRITETRIDYICRSDLADNGCCYCNKLQAGNR